MGLGLGALVCSVAPWGCGKGNRPSTDILKSNLKPLVALYNQYRGGHQGKAPANEAEFKKFIGALGQERLAPLTGGKDMESLFTSPRDKKPYVIRYGQQAAAPGAPAEPSVLAYEQEGVGGKRLVITTLGEIQELDEAQWKQPFRRAEEPKTVTTR